MRSVTITSADLVLGRESLPSVTVVPTSNFGLPLSPETLETPPSTRSVVSSHSRHSICTSGTVVHNGSSSAASSELRA
jgi:hypothetical protein